MHVKMGRPVSFRIDDDLTPMPGAWPVTDEIIRYMLGILLSERHLALHCPKMKSRGCGHCF